MEQNAQKFVLIVVKICVMILVEQKMPQTQIIMFQVIQTMDVVIIVTLVVIHIVLVVLAIVQELAILLLLREMQVLKQLLPNI